MSDQSTEIVLSELRDLRIRMDERFDTQDTEITVQGKQITEFHPNEEPYW